MRAHSSNVTECSTQTDEESSGELVRLVLQPHLLTSLVFIPAEPEPAPDALGRERHQLRRAAGGRVEAEDIETVRQPRIAAQDLQFHQPVLIEVRPGEG